MTIKVRLNTTRDAKQPKCDVTDNLRKVVTGREHRERLLNFTLTNVDKWSANFEQVTSADHLRRLQSLLYVLCKRTFSNGNTKMQCIVASRFTNDDRSKHRNVWKMIANVLLQSFSEESNTLVNGNFKNYLVNFVHRSIFF